MDVRSVTLAYLGMRFLNTVIELTEPPPPNADLAGSTEVPPASSLSEDSVHGANGYVAMPDSLHTLLPPRLVAAGREMSSNIFL